MMSAVKLPALLVFSSLFLAACGGGSSGGGNADQQGGDDQGADSQSGFGGLVTTAEEWGYIDVYDAAGFFLSATASFQRNGSAFDGIYRDSIIGPLPALDYCIVEANVADPNDTIDLVYLDAGDSVDVETSAGPFLSMSKLQFQSFLTYGNPQIAQSTVVPTGLVASFPGGEVPAMTGLPFPDIETLTNVSHCGQTGLEPSAEFQWTATSANNTLISISAQASNASGGTDRLVTCFAADDGSFSLPAESLSQLLPGDSLTVTSISRLARNTANLSGFPMAIRRSSNACVR